MTLKNENYISKELHEILQINKKIVEITNII